MAASGVARFAAGATRVEVRVETLDDSHDEGRETFAVLLSDARGGVIADGAATGTIVNTDPLPRAWLGRLGRSVAEQALDGIGGRVEQAGGSGRAPGFRGTLGGRALGGGSAAAARCPAGTPPAAGDGTGSGPPDGVAERDCPADHFGPMAVHPRPTGGHAMGGTLEPGTFGTGPGAPPGNPAWPHWGVATAFSRRPARPGGDASAMDLGRLLAGSRFTHSRGEDGGGGVLGLWGRGSRTTFDGRGDGVDLDGGVTTALLGVDYARGDWLLGVALAQSRGAGGYRGAASGSGAAGDIGASLTAAIPYGAWRPSGRLSLWGAVGHGGGSATLEPAGSGSLETDIGWRMAAAGAGGGSVSLVSDALWARTMSEGAAGLAGAAADVGRLRLGLEGSRRFALPGGGGLTPKLEIGARRDSGDAESGLGVEVGGGLAWSDPGLGIELGVEGRALLAHGDGAMEERGFSASLSYDPRPATARGLSLSLRQELGGASGGGLEALFADDPLARRAGVDRGGRWTLEAGYGLPALGGLFVGTPHVRYGTAGGTRELGLGWRLTPAPGGSSDLSLSLRASRLEGPPAPAEHRLGLELRVRW